MKTCRIHFHIITLFPEALQGYFAASIIGRAVKDGLIKVSYYNPRDYTKDKWRRIDRRPYGGGPGMVIEALPVVKAVEAALRNISGRKSFDISNDQLKRAKTKIVFFSAGGKQFTNKTARGYARTLKHLILIAGHYEGIDVRAQKILKAEAVSIGPYVLSGGEAPALVVADAIARQIPGVLGNLMSLEEERMASSNVYTRPEVLVYKGKKYRVPKILLSGHHAKIEEWKKRR
ncbi:tRNA (guanosine(37)-N1)-methyltransferase TrmD [Candidatus Kaiserbacteria bacterium RIFCSPHIGHO2_01_FULL_51_33]|uniref:tRNA (guanine-N(1)-)-methyltransferase n=1 Tax=Candidatus Kaiserbacteria bacterium RIFCSPLOWO2_01_FULL_51_21 TaxID=1798508 RepID=A0A1F6ECJ3_9BACT|nr:MAG: tRNA (guanosine(37)-N1)-methyltransferase TrmD [Candidatus Kaiserbacteria bacterium RIFCSPHIGHO2_01_FULL_51_33]OGG71366.1 MAG: tRNA (guanosine(37)-N1)-methyltransferase TrmD [Candidatus Kaiserbacteria bacterium RIFCSPLOWO2_01_FULL_51_21]